MKSRLMIGMVKKGGGEWNVVSKKGRRGGGMRLGNLAGE